VTTVVYVLNINASCVKKWHNRKKLSNCHQMEIHVSAHGRITQTSGPWDTMFTWKKVSGHVRTV